MVNKVILIGNLGQDPEIRQFETNSVASFSLATSESYIDKAGQKQTITEWHRISVWGKAAEIVQKYLKKGSKVYVEGKLTYRKYTDAQGVERNVTEIKADNFRFLDSASSSGTSNFAPKDDEKPIDAPKYEESMDDLPF
ncbi:MAG: single-stranded DNA-binding protein [Saprospiraceae bacterium]|jgi:single-strand DNA-binding protein|nr:single-stranded DNA-binding protein [Saprospiraceae bacterium]